MEEKTTDNLAKNVALGFLCLAVLWRLFIWKFFPQIDIFVKEDLSNLLSALPILIIGVVYYLRKAVLGRPWQERRTGLEAVLGALVLVCAISLIPSIDRTASLRYFVVWFSYVLFFFMLTETLDHDLRRKWFLVFIWALVLLIAGWGIRDYWYLVTRPPDPSDEKLANTNDSLYYILTNKRACSLFGWPNVLAGFLGVTAPLVATAALAWRSRAVKWLAGVSFFVALITLLLTFSFLGWLSLLIGFAGALLALIVRREWIGRGLGMILLAFAVVAVIAFSVVIAKKNFAISVSPRQQYLYQSFQGIKEHPLLGTGLDTFRYASARKATDKGGLTAFAHNSYLQMWVEAGLPGFLVLLALVFLVLRKFYRLVRTGDSLESRLRAAAFAWAMTACFVDNLWSFTIIKPNISIFFWVALSYVCSFDTREVVVKENWKPFRVLTGYGLILIILPVIFFNARGAYAQWLCRNAYRWEMQGRGDEAVRSFQAAKNVDRGDPRISFELGKRYVQSFYQTHDQNILSMAEQEFLDSVDNAPFYGSRLMMGLICKSQGRLRESRDWMQAAYGVSPLETDRDLRAIGIVR